MPQLKRWFISAFIGYTALASLAALYRLSQSSALPEQLSWLGALLASGTPLLFFVGLFVRPQARTSANLSGYWLGLIPGVLLSLLSPSSAALALISLAGWLIYLHWYSHLERGNNSVLQVGQQLPEITLQRADGSLVHSSDWLGQPNLLLFFRGNWCPLCMAQIAEVADQYQALSARGVKIRLISPQAEEHTAKLAQRFSVDFDYLIDPQLKAARTLQIFAEGGLPVGLEAQGYSSDTVYPTVLITDSQGVVRYSDLTDNYRVRPEPAEFIAEIDRLQLSSPR